MAKFSGLKPVIAVQYWTAQSCPKSKIIVLFRSFNVHPMNLCCQKYIQMVFVVAAVLCVPVLLLVKPFVLRARHNNKMKVGGVSWYYACVVCYLAF